MLQLLFIRATQYGSFRRFNSNICFFFFFFLFLLLLLSVFGVCFLFLLVVYFFFGFDTHLLCVFFSLCVHVHSFQRFHDVRVYFFFEMCMYLRLAISCFHIVYLCSQPNRTALNGLSVRLCMLYWYLVAKCVCARAPVFVYFMRCTTEWHA